MKEEPFVQWALDNKIIKRDVKQSKEVGYIRYKGKCPWCNSPTSLKICPRFLDSSGIKCYGQDCRFKAFSLEEFKKKSHEGEPKKEAIRRAAEKEIKEAVKELNIKLNKKGYNVTFDGEIEIESI